MTQDEKEILLKDLCARLPYGVKGRVFSRDYNNRECEFGATIDGKLYDRFAVAQELWFDNVIIKPYLFPLSNMTKEQYEEWCDLEAEPLDEILTRNANGEKMSTLEHHLLIAKSLTDSVNYCYKNHFDVYGLIPMGLAEDATDKNIY